MCISFGMLHGRKEVSSFSDWRWMLSLAALRRLPAAPGADETRAGSRFAGVATGVGPAGAVAGAGAMDGVSIIDCRLWDGACRETRRSVATDWVILAGLAVAPPLPTWGRPTAVWWCREIEAGDVKLRAWPGVGFGAGVWVGVWGDRPEDLGVDRTERGVLYRVPSSVGGPGRAARGWDALRAETGSERGWRGLSVMYLTTALEDRWVGLGAA